MPLDQLLLFIAAGVLLNLTPGPDVLYIVSNALRSGARAGPAPSSKEMPLAKAASQRAAFREAGESSTASRKCRRMEASGAREASVEVMPRY